MVAWRFISATIGAIFMKLGRAPTTFTIRINLISSRGYPLPQGSLFEDPDGEFAILVEPEAPTWVEHRRQPIGQDLPAVMAINVFVAVVTERAPGGLAQRGETPGGLREIVGVLRPRHETGVRFLNERRHVARDAAEDGPAGG